MPIHALAAGSPPLRERLVEAALELIGEEGLEALSLRQIARRAGVSHGAPLRHFRSHADLLAETAARGFRELSQAVARAGAELAPGAGPRARLAAAGRAYVRSAVARPGLFALMFRPEALDLENPSFREHAGAAFEQVVRHVRAVQDAGWHPRRETRRLAACVWSGVHGLATLWAQGALAGPVPDAALDDLLRTAFELWLGEAPEARGGPSA